MKNFLLGAVFGAVSAVYFTGNLKITAEGISITTDRVSSTPDPVKPPEVQYHGSSTPDNPPTAA